jgi:tetratricopeptide (TPR) repeat protein
MKYVLPTLIAAAALGSVQARAGDLNRELLQFQQQWAHVNYELPADQRAVAFEQLATQEEALVQHYPGRAEPLIWHGILLSAEAGAKGGLGGLSLAKQARDQLLAAEKIDPAALQGSAETSLGTLYYKVPGWPLGFGDDAKAEAYLNKALQVNPDGIDPNYFYADFLYGKHRYPEAMQALRKAMAAPPRPNRAVADKGRRQEIQALMAKVRDEAGDSIKSAER